MMRLLTLLILVLDVVAIMDILNSRKDNEKKILWIIAVIFLPVMGPVLYLAVARYTRR